MAFINKSFPIRQAWLLLPLLVCCCNGVIKIMGADQKTKDKYFRFQNSPAWPLARAIMHDSCVNLSASNNIASIIDFQEPKFGETLLMTTIRYDDCDCSAHLLKLGASPNMHNTSRGESPVILAANNNLDGKLMTLLLEHGGNPNDVEIGDRQKGNNQRDSPLIRAARAASMTNVKILVRAGAFVDFENEFGTTAFDVALVQEHYNIALFLLENGASFSEPVLKRTSGPIYAKQLLQESANSQKLTIEGQKVLDFISHH